MGIGLQGGLVHPPPGREKERLAVTDSRGSPRPRGAAAALCSGVPAKLGAGRDVVLP